MGKGIPPIILLPWAYDKFVPVYSLLQDETAKLEESRRALESELETLRQAMGKEEREKADILSAEKKARAQVRKTTIGSSSDVYVYGVQCQVVGQAAFLRICINYRR